MKPAAPFGRSKPSMDVRPGEAATAPSAAAPAAAGDDAERALIGRAQARETNAFRELVDRHRDRAYGLALRIVRSPPDAEEVVQDAFVRAWLALPQYRGEARFGTWLHRIVARRAIDRARVLRTRRQRESALEDAPEPSAAPPPNAEPGREVTMARALETLTEIQRAVVTMFYYEDRSVQQVAIALGLPDGTVKTHLSRARAALRKTLASARGGGSA
jgi:RNA polymerase sigma-70 factor, ECF subfamily